MSLGPHDKGYLLFQAKMKKFPTGMPSMRISSPVIEDVIVPSKIATLVSKATCGSDRLTLHLPKGPDELGSTTVVSQ